MNEDEREWKETTKGNYLIEIKECIRDKNLN